MCPSFYHQFEKKNVVYRQFTLYSLFFKENIFFSNFLLLSIKPSYPQTFQFKQTSNTSKTSENSIDQEKIIELSKKG